MGLIACLFLLALRGAFAGDHGSIQIENREVKLQSIRSKIKDVQSNIDSAKSNTETYQKELQEKEKAAARIAGELRDMEAKIRSGQAKLKQLQKQKSELEDTLARQRRVLAEQIRIAYETGRHDFLRLLLNQEDPALVGRMVTYHEYYSRARARHINAVRESLQRLDSLQASIRTQTSRLEKLRAGHRASLVEYRKYRKSRQAVIAELMEYIAKQGKQLQHLQHNEKELSSLLSSLKSKQLAIQAYEDLPPFGSLKGKLSWPVRGRFVHHYGEALRGGKLRSHGVRIAVKSGTDVHAVSGGRVIFADWFRNLGLLMIIDHGNGYMSLYGNNEKLLKKPGDMVSKNEVIAKVGDTGGQNQAGLYFEIRLKGTPRNPALWCRR
ncbi:MAG: peptidoglycan DD-metalloendopeptidase family protein [Gammaproteobacteria bacterium]